jgi:hypothetical protein
MNLFLVMIRMYLYSFKVPKPLFKEELNEYLRHILNATIIWLILIFLFF